MKPLQTSQYIHVIEKCPKCRANEVLVFVATINPWAEEAFLCDECCGKNKLTIDEID